MENKLQRQNSGLSSSVNILPQRIIREQPDKIAVQNEIAALLERVVILYQIPNWTSKNAIILSEWIMDNYKYETLETIKACLKNPPPTKDNNWRLTPDTIHAWFSFELEKNAEKREQENQKRKESELRLGLIEGVDKEFNLTDEQKVNIDKYATHFLESIKNTDLKPMRPMSEDEIKTEGGARDADTYFKEYRRNYFKQKNENQDS